eukprot:TRINITY_DN1766_c0_g1_i4.p1 TRINITY_DN1766_c0_g1~~TRINITY_DN1766_c0_g1_i4.p1  ORF type:complete len:679 (-),score=123.41 TRINITY_DN1766_c0_g1_i4:328-2364(-)
MIAQVGLHVVDTQGVIRWANKTEMDLLGYTEEEYIGQPVTKFHADEGKVGEILDLLLSGQKVVNYIAPLRCKDGHIEYVEINSSMKKVDGKVSTTRCFSAVVTDKVLAAEAKEKLRRAEIEAASMEEQSASKTGFLRVLCHELRNPMTAVLGNNEMLAHRLKGYQDAMDSGMSFQDSLQFTTDIVTQLPQLSKFCRNALLSLDHMGAVLNETLTMSKMEADQGIVITSAVVDLRDLFQSVLSMFEIQAETKGIELRLDLTELGESPLFRTDKSWLSQIVINLLSNALKFTDQGQVAVTGRVLERKGGIAHLEFRVTDTGIGIAPSEQSKLFEVFAQANDQIQGEYGGSGLGLNIVKTTLAKMGGSIRVESAKGQGSEFIFDLPCAVAGSKPVPDQHRSPSQTAPVSAKDDPTAPHILIVDDDNILRDVLAEQLLVLGCTVTAVGNGTDAIQRTSGEKFSMILMDIDLQCPPNGLETTIQIRSGGLNAETPIVAVSGNSLEDDFLKGEQAGMNGYIVKPYTLSTLRVMVTEYTQNLVTPKPRSILVVDDNESVRSFLVDLLGELDPKARIEQAADGDDAVAKSIESPFDLIFLDVNMGATNGIDATKSIRSGTTNAQTPIVCLSGSTAPNEVDAVLQAGMTDFVPKPYGMNDIQRVLAKHKPHRPRRRSTDSDQLWLHF